MLTMKFNKTDGNHVIIDVTEAHFYKIGQPVTQSLYPAAKHDFVLGWLPSGGVVTGNDGDVYVMNANGQTIADYHLGAPKDSI